jgi:hypothetical protein
MQTKTTAVRPAVGHFELGSHEHALLSRPFFTGLIFTLVRTALRGF